MKETYKYAVASPTSMGVRITPDDRMAVHNSNHFYMQATSAERNVINIASSLGEQGLVLTKFVKGSPVAAFIKSQLHARNICYEGIEVDQGGPWGYRHQFNIADSGFGLRAPRVWNDRAGEVGRTLRIDEFDIPRIFGEEGVAILHVSGLIAAMSPETTKFCLEVAKAAKQYGTQVSFDLNYRATFWKGREEELGEAFQRIAEKKHFVGSRELEAIIASTALQVPSTYRIADYVVTAGGTIGAMANITLEKDGKRLGGVCAGDGPIDAAFLAIEQAIGHHYELDDFQIQTVSEGREAMGSALVKLRSGGRLYSGNGLSTDIIGSSIRAYVSALNKIVYEEA